MVVLSPVPDDLFSIMQEPRSIRLFKDLLGHRRLVHNAGERRSSSFPSLLNLSLPSSDVKFLNLEWRKFNGLAGQVGGSRNIFCELFGGNNAEYTFWLDSASTEVCLLLKDVCLQKIFNLNPN